MRRSFFVTVALMSACAAPEHGARDEGPIAHALSAAAKRSGVPRDLLVAIAAYERGVELAPHRVVSREDHVPVAGYLELRHGRFDSLARAAELTGVTQDALIEDTLLATDAGADVVAELGRQLGATDALESWTSALEELSGMSGSARATYAHDVLTLLQSGTTAKAFSGELVHVGAHTEVPALGNPPAPALTSQYPGGMWFPTSCTNKCDTTRTSGVAIDTIVIHDTEGSWTASVATLQNDPAKSVHYIVDADGSRVGQFVDESVDAWHGGNTAYNNRSIGIEHVGFAANPDGYADALYVTSASLVANIRTRHQVAVDRTHIIGHYQIPNGDVLSETAAPCSEALMSCETSANYGGTSLHRDPGPSWQWCQYMARLGGTCACNDASAHLTCTTDRTQASRCVDGKVELQTCASACVPTANGQDDQCDAVTPAASGMLQLRIAPPQTRTAPATLQLRRKP